MRTSYWPDRPAACHGQRNHPPGCTLASSCCVQPPVVPVRRYWMARRGVVLALSFWPKKCIAGEPSKNTSPAWLRLTELSAAVAVMALPLKVPVMAVPFNARIL
jgi:hypothetical protein